MRIFAVFAFVVYCFNFISCTKERQLPSAALSFRFENRSQDVEWVEVSGSRNAGSDNLYIIADGADNERFYLKLEHVKKGLVQNITAKNIAYFDGYGFKTGSLQSVEISIKEINDHRIYGSFRAVFINSTSNSNSISANGEFSILGSE